MKILQNHFTTQEQSKRLLELGVPADSADCYYQNAIDARIIPAGRLYKEYTDSLTGLNRKIWYFKPCWSVGRLIEISIICGIGDRVPNELYINKYSLVDSLVENIIFRLERIARVNEIDFSKL